MKIAHFDPAPCGFPGPSVFPLPQRLEIRGPDEARAVSPAFPGGGRFCSFSRGRYALAEAYRRCGLSPATTLLAPSYHCLTMLDPAVNLGANLLLYPLREDLSPDIDVLDRIVRNAARPVKALVATHFFGIIRDFGALRRWCDDRGIVLIEDGSHVFFTENHQAAGAGRFGQYVISSPYKFIASEDGGLLYAPESRDLDGLQTRRPGWLDELRGIKRAIERHRAARRVPDGGIASIDARLAELDRSAPSAGARHVAVYAHPSPNFSVAGLDRAALLSSRWLARIAPAGAIARARRHNFQRWIDAVAALPACRALYQRLPEECVPYMFPLLIDHPDPHFYHLKHLGVPVWRWDELAISSCLVAHRYRLHLLHLPCHQSLTPAQMDWMIAAVEKVMRRPVQETA